MLFTDLPLEHQIIKNLELKGLTGTTEIQSLAIPYGLMGKDLLASSKTGSGKTLAFLVPALQRVLKSKPLSRKDPRVLILAPTRELAKQVFLQLKWLIAKQSVSAVLILGGENFNDQVKALRRNPQFIVGTAGRIADHLSGKTLFLNGLELLIMDEADRMLDLGFAPQLKDIHRSADHRKRQTMMFSATLDSAPLHNLTQTMLRAPQRISVGSANEQHKDIEQRFYFADHIEHKEALLFKLLETEQYEQVMIFTATRADTERLSKLLNEQGKQSIGLSAELSQGMRSNVMNEFSRNQQQILVTTDVASRGLDLLKVSLVINFDMPKLADEYVHRVGRTGRAGNKGQAISLIGPKDWLSFTAVRSFLQQDIAFSVIEGLEAKFKGLKEVKLKDKKVVGGKPKAKINKPAALKKRIKSMDGVDAGHAPMLRRARKDVIEEDDSEEERE